MDEKLRTEIHSEVPSVEERLLLQFLKLKEGSYDELQRKEDSTGTYFLEIKLKIAA